MKKVVALVISLFAALAHGQDAPPETGADAAALSYKLGAMIERSLDKNYQSIAETSLALESAQKTGIYSHYKKSPNLGFGLNLAVGLGLGSFVQNDPIAGATAATLEILGIVLISVGYSGSINDMSGAEYYSNSALIGWGAMILAGGKVFELVAPFSFAEKYNKRLRAALGLAGEE